MKKFLLIVLTFIFITPAFAQTVNSGSWSMLAIKAPVGEKVTLGYNHIFLRRNDYYKNKNQMFGDFTIGYKLNSQFSFQLLNRYVFVPEDNNDAIWFFLDANHVWKKSEQKFSIKNRLRLHYGTELLNDPDQGDFLRYTIDVKAHIHPTLTPFITMEPFYQFNGINKFQRVRYELGTRWKIAPHWNLAAMYRIEDFNSTIDVVSHFIVIGLTYKI